MNPHDIPALTALFREGIIHLTNMAKGMESPFDMTLKDPRQVHNMYRPESGDLLRQQVLRIVDVYSRLGRAVELPDLRSMWAVTPEATATLRYYVMEEYKPLLDGAEAAGSVDLNKLIAIDDRHLRGTRFDWESFIFRDYAKLREGVLTQLEAKRKKKGPPAAQETIIAPQVNVLTCVEKWAQEQPVVLIAYNLFCDLVHPNIGSAFLIASSSSDGQLFFSRFRGSSIGQRDIVQSFPILVSNTHKPFGELLTILIGTVWQEDEL